MRCFKCKKLSLRAICKDCQKLYLITTAWQKELSLFEVVSFFDYFTISEFIKSKYHPSGYKIYQFLAKEYLNSFLKAYMSDKKQNYYLISVGESLKRDYSPSAVLLHYASKGIKNLKPLYNVLEAKNKVVYAGKSLEFRLQHPRGFEYEGPKEINVILLDDLITTGTTLNEAFSELKRFNVNVEFALTLANIKKGLDY